MFTFHYQVAQIYSYRCPVLQISKFLCLSFLFNIVYLRHSFFGELYQLKHNTMLCMGRRGINYEITQIKTDCDPNTADSIYMQSTNNFIHAGFIFYSKKTFYFYYPGMITQNVSFLLHSDSLILQFDMIYRVMEKVEYKSCDQNRALHFEIILE